MIPYKHCHHTCAGKVSDAAKAMLSTDWSHCPAATAGTAKNRGGSDCGWKNRAVPMAALLKHFVGHHSRPLDLLLELADLLAQTPLPDSDYAGDNLTL